MSKIQKYTINVIPNFYWCHITSDGFSSLLFPEHKIEFYFNGKMTASYTVKKESIPDVLPTYCYITEMASNNLGTFETLGPDTPPLTIKTLNELYWILGDMTFCERAAMLANVCSPENRNIRMMKRLAEINLVKGDYDAARKYLRILQKTFVWSRWANRAFDALGRKASSYDKALLQQYIDKRPYLNTRDTLRLNDNCHTIMSELMESNPNNNIAVNYMLCSDLLLKDMETFKYDYDAYYLKQQNITYEKLYQEALAIYLAGTKAPPAEWAKYIKRQDVLQRFKLYNEQRGNPAFKDTYWYYFDKAEAPKLNNN